MRGPARQDLCRCAAPSPENLILPQAEALIRATGADLRIGGDRAFYVPSADYIQVPRRPRILNQSIGIARFFTN